MAKRMLIDATHPEETRVVVVNGNRLEEFDFESSTKQQVKGNIYLARVTRVEPSLQAAFIEYGGNRHGFLAFSEIHPDYFRIPVGDRSAGDSESGHPDTEDPEAASEAFDEAGVPLEAALPEPVAVTEATPDGEDEPTALEPFSETSWMTESRTEVSPITNVDEQVGATAAELPWAEATASPLDSGAVADRDQGSKAAHLAVAALDEGIHATGLTVPAAEETSLAAEEAFPATEENPVAAKAAFPATEENPPSAEDTLETAPAPEARDAGDREAGEAEVIETLGGDEFEEAERQRSRAPRHYKIQEVIKRRQIMLVQVTKEERGNKGAALTTYLSLAGRYCVLMPNTARGGGVSRKITSISDRRRLKDILEELDIPEGMGVIVRTAGGERSKAEIKRDYEYLLRLWNEIRELTLKSTAPALIYEEGNLIKRSIRDLYTRDIDEVLVEGEEGYRTAKAFMKMLMPSHAKRVQPYRDPQIGLLHRFQIEGQIDAIHSPIVQLRSGGYVVINQTEALVAIDVNSGRSTRERNIEETAARTNLEAAEEIARQLRLRDLAGLIVIDFIDMEEHRNQGAVERRLKDALKNDRARIQVGRISPFGLLEMSRQRLRPSLVEASTQPCPHCGGTGFIRSTESTALYVLRSIEEEGMRRRSAEVYVYVPTTVALYILNHKRDSLAQLEARYGIHVLMAQDDALIPPAFRLERLRAYGPSEAPAAIPAPLTQAPEIDEEEPEDEAEEAVDAGAQRHGREADEERGRGRRRRRRRRHEDEPGDRGPAPAAPAVEVSEDEAGERVTATASEAGAALNGEQDAEVERQRRRRGRRGGRRRVRREDGFEPGLDGLQPAAATIEIVAITDDGGEPGPKESELAEGGQRIVEAETRWPEEIPTDPVVAAAATKIETASLPALAGEPAAEAAVSSHNGAAPAELAEPAAIQFVEKAPPHAGLAEQGMPAEGVDRFSPPPYSSEREPASPFAADREEQSVQPGALEPPGMPPLPTEPAQAAQAAVDKPANPRKGWWQRLIQS
jgi:ribonuclease E